MADSSEMIVYAAAPEYLEEATHLAESLGVMLTQDISCARHYAGILRFDDAGITLSRDGLEMQGDFSAMFRRYQSANLRNEMLVKASGIFRKNSRSNAQQGCLPLAVDATAGMGEDAFLLAASGFQVYLFERDPVIAALLKDSLDRGRKNPEISEIISRMKLFRTDSIPALKKLKEKPDIILLDPMFPERQKTGLVKKKFQLLHFLQKPCSDAEELMEAAESAKPGRIIVKRPLKGAYLAGKAPDYSLKGRSIRYDCYLKCI